MTVAEYNTGDAGSTDPGTELVDLPDELALQADDVEALAEPSHVPLVDIARLTGHASDYEWAGWLADVLKIAGLSVITHDGWRTRGRPRAVGPFTPRGVIVHHDASPKGPSPAMAEFIFNTGRPAEGIPAPLSQLWVCEGCKGDHPVGTWHIGAAGRANHAGIGKGWGAIGENLGTTLTLGIETDNTVNEKTPPEMYDSLVVGIAAIFQRLGTDPADWLAGHKEYAAGRKIDPDDINMKRLRRDVGEQLRSCTGTFLAFPGREHFQIGHQCAHGYVRDLEQWLLTINPKSRHNPSDTFTRWTQDTVAKFQASRKALAGDADGIPGPKTWRKLQLAARVATTRQTGGVVR